MSINNPYLPVLGTTGQLYLLGPQSTETANLASVSYGKGYWGANVDAASIDYTGDGVLINLNDTGFDLTHTDLDGINLSASSDATLGSASHGTGTLGILAAEGGAVGGIYGIAWEAEMILHDAFDFQDAGHSNFALLADVSSNSWVFDNFQASGSRLPDILEAAEDGRGGLGTTVVMIAGNSRIPAHTGQDNTNYSDITASIYAITVGATETNQIPGHDSTTEVASFSTPGASLFLVAPGSEIATTQPGNTYAQLGGTSYAAPIVAGTVALLYEANPGLGYRDVQEILAQSARWIDQDNTGDWNLDTWNENGAATHNNNGMEVSHDYGFGLVDARAATRLAETWDIAGTVHEFSNLTQLGHIYTLNQGTSLNANTLTYTVNLSSTYDEFRLQWVTLDAGFTHTDWADVSIEIVSPSSIHSELMVPDVTGSGSGAFSRVLSTTHDWGEYADGTWTVNITDDSGGGTGTLTGLRLDWWGDDLNDNDTFYFNDDFVAGTTLTDSNGGTDTINAAAVTGVVSVNLTTGTPSIDGHTFSISGTMENIIGGDGADTIVGNSSANILAGSRGNDIISGMTGADTMYGGRGNDIMYVDNAGDTVIENANEGTFDSIITTVTYTAPANVEYIRIETGAGALDATGNSGDNFVFGNESANTLTGGGGSDVLVGFAGNDAMSGGTGDDSYVVEDAGDSVTENSSEGSDTVYTMINNYTLPSNVESLLMVSGSAAVTATGNSLNNVFLAGSGSQTIDGAGGNDTIDGGFGADTMTGGSGDDGFYVDDAGDVVIEGGSGGTDTILASVSYTMAANVENMVLNDVGGTIDATGNSAANAIFGNFDPNIINGVGGADILVGLAGNDTFYFTAAQANGDWVYDFAGNGASAGDALEFHGYGTAAQGATLTQIGATNQWAVHAFDNSVNDVITVTTNGVTAATIHASDYTFV